MFGLSVLNVPEGRSWETEAAVCPPGHHDKIADEPVIYLAVAQLAKTMSP